MDLFNKRTKTIKEYYNELRQNKSSLIATGLIVLSTVAVIFSGVVGLNTAIKDKHYSVVVTQNSRMDGLKSYAARYPDNFYFYDANDFISCTEYVFKTYEEGTILNHDSMGSWNVHAPSYYERNNAFGFSTSVNGLTAEKGNVYFVATGTLRMGITKTLKDVYNKTLRLVETVDSDNFVLYVYMVTDDD